MALAELADRLNMGQEQLQALEDGDAGRLPEPVFVIAQARRVASCLAIDVDGPLQALRECGAFQARPVKVADLSTSPSPQPPTEAGSRGLQTLGQLALAAGLLAAVIGGGSAGWQQLQRLQRPQASQPQPAPPAVAPSTPAPTAAPTRQPTGTPGQLLLRSSQPSWLEVKAEGGGVLFRGSFQGERRFPLGSGLQVLAGRPDLVQLSLAGGAAQPLGRIDQVRWRRFTAPAPGAQGRRPPVPPGRTSAGSNAPG